MSRNKRDLHTETPIVEDEEETIVTPEVETPTDYDGVPATSYRQPVADNRMNCYTIVGDQKPEVGDLVCIHWEDKTFVGRVYEYTSDEVIRLNRQV